MVKKIMSTPAFLRMVEIDTINLPGEDQPDEQERLDLVVNRNPYHMIEPNRVKMLQNPNVATRLMLAAQKNAKISTQIGKSVGEAVAQSLFKSTPNGKKGSGSGSSSNGDDPTDSDDFGGKVLE
jgi:hypothetical protein